MALRALALGAAGLALSASSAYALSCAQPQIERSFNGWVDSEDTYYIGVGALEPIGPLPKIASGYDASNLNSDREPVTAQYSFSGRLLNGEQGVPYTMPITVRVNCIASWCGGFPQSGKTGLMALRGVGILNLTLDIHACPGSIFPAETEKTVTDCIRAGRCEGG